MSGIINNFKTIQLFNEGEVFMKKYLKFILKYIFVFIINLVVYFIFNSFWDLFEVNSSLKILQMALILTTFDILYDLSVFLFRTYKQKNPKQK